MSEHISLLSELEKRMDDIEKLQKQKAVLLEAVEYFSSQSFIGSLMRDKAREALDKIKEVE